MNGATPIFPAASPAAEAARLRRAGRAACIALLLAAGGATCALAQPVPEAPATPPEPTLESQLESLRQATRQATQWLARRIDGLFGEQPFEQGGQVSDGRLTLSAFRRQDEGNDVDLRFNARFRLPNAERRAFIFVGRDDPRATVRDTPADLFEQQRQQSARPQERSVLAGLGLNLRDDIELRLGVGARLKPYAQARAEQRWADGAEGPSLVLRQTLFWTVDERLGATVSAQAEWPLARQLSLRWLNTATLSQRTRPAEWGSTLSLTQAFAGRRLFTLEALARGTARARSGTTLADTGVLVKWEQPLHADWLFGELQAGQFQPRQPPPGGPGRAWALGAALRMEF